MTISGYSNAIVGFMLGWLKGLANWVLRLFNLAGSVRVSPLLWLSQNWLKLLVFFLVLGIVLDRLIWLIRWRPYWVWFRKERVIVNDDRFFINADMDKASDWEGDLASNWDEHDYVVASTVVRRQDGARSHGAAKDGKRPSGKSAPAAKRKRGSTKVRRHESGNSDTDKNKRADGHKSRPSGEEAHAQTRKKSPARPGSIFEGELKDRNVSDSYEDEVFNVSSLPSIEEYEPDGKQERKPRRGRR